VRTAEGMAAILEIEKSLDAVLSAPGPSSHAETLNSLLRSHIGDSDSDADGEADSDYEGIVLDGVTSDKRKLFVFTLGCNIIHPLLITSSQKWYIDPRARKCARIHAPHASDATIELWWEAQSSEALIGNTLPPLPSLTASGPVPPPSPSQSQDQPTSSAKTMKRKRRPPKPATTAFITGVDELEYQHPAVDPADTCQVCCNQRCSCCS
jgi:hypothetical protein